MLDPLKGRRYTSAFKTKQKNEMLKRASFNIPSFVLHYVINGQDWPEGDEVYHSWVSVPTLLINGRDDTFATLEDAKLMKATIHGSKLEIVDEASHMVMLEAPDKVNKLILEFICSRGSHKLPDVKELAEEGIETPQRSTVDEKQFEPSQEGDEQTLSPETYTHKWTSVHRESTPRYAEEEREGDREHDDEVKEEVEDEYDRDNEDEDEVIITIPSKSSPSQRDGNNIENAARYRCKLKKGVVTGYDNASYEFEESEGGFYIYKDQYDQNHYVSADEFHELFDKSNKQANSSNETKEVNNIEVKNMNIPSFEDINIFENCKETYVKESRLNHQETSSSCKNKTIDINILPLNLSQNASKSSNEGQMETHAIYPNSMSSFDPKCKKGMNRPEVDINSKHHGSRPVKTQPSVTLALGRQRSDSLDYLGEEELIIITLVKEKEKNCMFLKDSSHDTTSMKNASEISILNKGILQQIPNKKEYNESDCNSLNFSRANELSTIPVKPQTFHSELVQKLNAKLNLRERTDIPETNDVTKKTHNMVSNEESIVNRSVSFLESRKLMEEHFSESAFKMNMGVRPVIPHPGASIVHYRSSQVSQKTYEAAKPTRSSLENTIDSRDSNNIKSPLCCPESSVVTSRSSFLQSKKAINEHFSKIGLRNPQLSSSPLPETKHSRNNSGSKIPPIINLRKEFNDIRLSPNNIQPNWENNNIDATESPSKAGLSLNEWGECHLQTISEIDLPTGMTSKECSPKISPKMSSPTSDKECKTEKHLKLISEFITPPATPVITNSRNSSENYFDDNDDENTENRFPLSQWAERHLKLISEQKSDIASSKDIPRDTLDKVSNVQLENDKNKTLSVSEWAERHVRKMSSMASNSLVASKPDVEQKRIEERKLEQQDAHINLSVSEWAERHARIISSMTSNLTTNSTLDFSENNDETNIIYESTSTVKIAQNNLSIKNWAEKHVNIISEINSSLNSGSRRNSAQRDSEEPNQNTASKIQNLQNNLIVNEWENGQRVSSMTSNSPGKITRNSSTVNECQLEPEHRYKTKISNKQNPLAGSRISNKNVQICSINDTNSACHHGNISNEDNHELPDCEVNQIDSHTIGSLPEVSEKCESKASRTIDRRFKDKVDTKFKDVIDQTEKNELVLQDEQNNIIDDEQEKWDAINLPELKQDIHLKKEKIFHMEAKDSKQKLQDAFSDCSELCEVNEIPHHSNIALNRWAEKHFQKILGAHTQSDSQKQTIQIPPQSMLDVSEDNERQNRKMHLYRGFNQNETNQHIIDNKSSAQKVDSKGPESESDSSSDICFESCYEHFPESPTNSQSTEFCSQYFVNDTDDMVSVADHSLASDITAKRLVFDDNSNIVDSDTDVYSDQFNHEEISINKYESVQILKCESNPILKYESSTNSQSSRSATSIVHSILRKQFNPNENTLASSKQQTLDSENSRSQLEIETTQASLTERTGFNLNENYSGTILRASYIAGPSFVDNSNITQRKHTLSSESGFNGSVSPQPQATSSSSKNIYNTDIIKSLGEENVLETDNDNNFISNYYDSVKFDDLTITTAITASTSTVTCSTTPILAIDSSPSLKAFKMNIL